MGVICKNAKLANDNAFKSILNNLTSKISREVFNMPITQEAKIVTEKINGLYQLYSENKSTIRSNVFSGSTRYNDVESVEDLLEAMTYGVVKNLSDIAKLDQANLGLFNLQIENFIKGYMQIVKDPRAAYKTAGLTSELTSQMKSIHLMLQSEKAIQKVLGTGFGITRLFGKEISESTNIMIDNTKAFRSFNESNILYANSSQLETLVESKTKDFTDMQNDLMDSAKHNKILKIEDIDNLIQYMDKQSGENIREQISKRKPGLSDGDLDIAVNEITAFRDKFNVMNYGVANPDENNWKWQDYESSFIHYINVMGNKSANFVIDSGRKYDELSETERNFVKKFAKVVSSSSSSDIKTISMDRLLAAGFTEDQIAVQEFRIGYIPFRSNEDQFAFISSTASELPGIQALQRRPRLFETSEKFSDIMQSNINSVRWVVNALNDHVFLHSLNNITKGPNFIEWSKNPQNTYYSSILTGYVKRMKKHNEKMKGVNIDTVSTSMFKNAAYAAISLQGTMGLAFSALNNIIAGSISKHNTLSATTFDAMKKSFDDDRNADDNPYQALAIAVENLNKSTSLPRRTEVLADEFHDDATLSHFNKVLNVAHRMSEIAMREGPGYFLRPFLGEAKDKIWSMAGSEEYLRDQFKYVLYAAAKANYNSKVNNKSIILDPSKNPIKTRMEMIARDTFNSDKAFFTGLQSDMFGDFSRKGKPFWSYLPMKEAQTIPEIIIGTALMSMYMFKSADLYSFTNGISKGLVRQLSDVKNMNASSVSMRAASNALMFATVEIIQDLLLPNSYQFPILQSTNQLQTPNMLAEKMYLMTAPMFGWKVTEDQSNQINEKLIRWGGGMLAGESLKNIYKTIDDEMGEGGELLRIGFSEKLDASKVLMNGLVHGVEISQFKDIRGAVKELGDIRFPIVGSIIGANNDYLRTIYNLTQAAAFIRTSNDESESGAQRDEFMRVMQRILLSPIGMNPFLTTKEMIGKN